MSDSSAVKPSAECSAEAVFDRGAYKRSRTRKGYLICRLTGYSIAETEYGVSYLFVTHRKPDRTSADNAVYPLAGYFNWQALAQAGLLIKEKGKCKKSQ